jgi:hypothetical protein
MKQREAAGTKLAYKVGEIVKVSNAHTDWRSDDYGKLGLIISEQIEENDAGVITNRIYRIKIGDNITAYSSYYFRDPSFECDP